jgi:hypothetical protein
MTDHTQEGLTVAPLKRHSGELVVHLGEVLEGVAGTRQLGRVSFRSRLVLAG